MDTRVNVHCLLGHDEYFGHEEQKSDPTALIVGIPSITIINYLAGINIQLYLNENGMSLFEVQFGLLNSIAKKFSDKEIQHLNQVIISHRQQGHQPIFFYRYSNLLFYDVVFKSWNNEPSRDFQGDEAFNFFRAYLIMNSVSNDRVASNLPDLEKAVVNGQLEDFILPNLAYQKDYESNTEFSNQLTKGIAFFEYLDNNPSFKDHIKEYYKAFRVSGGLSMFKNILTVFIESRVGKEKPKQVIHLKEYEISNEINLPFLAKVCINTCIEGYAADQSFTVLRNHFLFKVSGSTYILLDVNFLFDYLYKSQVFSVNSFLKSNSITNEFLSIKATEFMEQSYVPKLLDVCFPLMTRFYGRTCVNSKKEELCDFYLRQGNQIAIIEFKDVILNATAKNSGHKKSLISELDKKFLANQHGKQKGVSQLINALHDLEYYSTSFDSLPVGELLIYPIVLYTDSSFSIAGLNKRYNDLYNVELSKREWHRLKPQDITFICLSTFELNQDYFNQGLLNIFTLISNFSDHVKNKDYRMTTFEVFAKFFMEYNKVKPLGSPRVFAESTSKVVGASVF